MISENELLQSPLLAEASPQASMADLYSRDPLRLRRESKEDYARLVEALRVQAERMAAAALAGEKPPRLSRAKVKKEASIDEA